MVFAENRKFRIMGKNIGDDKNIVSANGLIQGDLAFAGLEADDLRLYHIITAQIPGTVYIWIRAFRLALQALLIEHIIDLPRKFIVGCVGNDSDRTEWFEQVTAKIGIKPFGIVRTLI
jgi:hypothetical protein